MDATTYCPSLLFRRRRPRPDKVALCYQQLLTSAPAMFEALKSLVIEQSPQRIAQARAVLKRVGMNKIF